MADINDTIQQTAADGVQTASVDGRTVTALPIADQIQAAQHTAAVAASSQPNRRGGRRSAWSMLRPAKVIPPGGTGDDGGPHR